MEAQNLELDESSKDHPTLMEELNDVVIQIDTLRDELLNLSNEFYDKMDQMAKKFRQKLIYCSSELDKQMFRLQQSFNQSEEVASLESLFSINQRRELTISVKNEPNRSRILQNTVDRMPYNINVAKNRPAFIGTSNDNRSQLAEPMSITFNISSTNEITPERLINIPLKKIASNSPSSNVINFYPAIESISTFIERYEEFIGQYPEPLTDEKKRDMFFSAVVNAVPVINQVNENYKEDYEDDMDYNSLKDYLLRYEAEVGISKKRKINNKLESYSNNFKNYHPYYDNSQLQYDHYYNTNLTGNEASSASYRLRSRRRKGNFQINSY